MLNTHLMLYNIVIRLTPNGGIKVFKNYSQLSFIEVQLFFIIWILYWYWTLVTLLYLVDNEYTVLFDWKLLCAYLHIFSYFLNIYLQLIQGVLLGAGTVGIKFVASKLFSIADDVSMHIIYNIQHIIYNI